MRASIRFLGVLAVFAAASGSWGDRGMIVFRPGTIIFEPTQRAMIAWNGKEEILLLSTDLHASQASKVLEVLPVPNEPKVTKGDVEVFRKAVNLINEKLPRPAAGPGAGGRGMTEKSGPGGEITFHEKIGAHDISVAHVLNAEGFVEWVNNYLHKAGVDNPVIPETLRASVQEYLKEQFAWFVFDVVELDEKPKTNEAIQYRFETDSLFYPLKISRTGRGETTVELLILTPRLLTQFPGIPIKQVELRHQPVSVTAKELQSLNEEMDALLGHRDDMKLRIWRIQGDIEKFDKDLIAR